MGADSREARRRQPCCDLGDKFARERELGGARQLPHALGVDEQEAVVILPEGERSDVADQQRNALPLPLGLGMLRQIFAFGRKADAEQLAAPGARTLCDRQENVLVLDELERRRLAAAVLLDL